MSYLRAALSLFVTCACAAGEVQTSPPVSTPAATPGGTGEPARAAADTKRPQQNFYLITDYLPPSLYDGDNFSACFRVESLMDGETTLSLQVNVFDAKGKPVRDSKERVVAPAKGFGSCQSTQETNSASRIEFALKNGSETIGSIAVRLLRQTEPWPATKIDNGRLVLADDTKTVLVPLVEKRLKQIDRAYAPIKWFVGGGQSSKLKKLQNGVVLAAIPGRWRLDLQRNDVIELGPYELTGMLPIVAALDGVLTELGKQNDGKNPRVLDRVIVALPPEDLEVATDPRVYRILIEVLLARLQAAGAKEIVLIPPFHFGVKEKYLQAVSGEVMKAVGLYLAQAVDPSEYLQEKLWRVDPNEEGVYGVRPNADGLEKLRQALQEMLP